MSKKEPRLETHIRLTESGKRLAGRVLSDIKRIEFLPSDEQKMAVLEFLQRYKDLIDMRIEPEEKFEDILKRMAEERGFPSLLVFKYVFRESAKIFLSAVESKKIDIALKRDQKKVLRKAIDFLKNICGRCGGEGRIQLGEGIQTDLCPECKGAGEITEK